MIVTEHPKAVINEIQNTLRRGITIVHDAEGAFRHEEKKRFYLRLFHARKCTILKQR